MIHNGGKLPSIVSVTKAGLTTGLPYRFYVIAENFIGQSIPSNIATVYSCTAPRNLPRPTRGTITETSVELFWSAPQDDGGCLITSYSIFRNDAGTGSFVEVHQAQVNNKPNLKTFTVTDLPANKVGSTIKFKIVATNKATYSTESTILAVVLAAVPSDPVSAPVSDFSVTS